MMYLLLPLQGWTILLWGDVSEFLLAEETKSIDTRTGPHRMCGNPKPGCM